MKDKKRSYKPWCNVVLVLFIVGISSGVFYIFQNQKSSLKDTTDISSLNKQEKEIRKTLVSKNITKISPDRLLESDSFISSDK